MQITQVEDVLRYLYGLNSASGRFCFRGQSDSNWPLIPTLHRPSLTLKRYQTVIFESFLLYCLQDSRIRLPHVYTGHPLEQLMMCQHYGIPTRLLDWTNDILVGLYFACEQNKNENGMLIICDKKYYKHLNFEKFRDVTTEPLLVESCIINPRMRAQSGLFMIWGTLPLETSSSETYTLSEYNEKHLSTPPITNLMVPANKKGLILNELSLKYGINGENLYLHNEFSRNTEKEYDKFKIIADKLMLDVTTIDNAAPNSFGARFNFAGCLNLQSFPEDPPRGFSKWLNVVFPKNVTRKRIGRNERCPCGSAVKYKHCCGRLINNPNK